MCSRSRSWWAAGSGSSTRIRPSRRPIPASLTFGGWLAGARNWHFAAMWLLFLNGLVYVGFIYLHGEWRDLVPRRGDLRASWEMIKFYTFARPDHPHQGKHNALQKSVY